MEFLATAQKILEYPLFRWQESAITFGQLIAGPLALLVLWAAYKWMDRLITQRILARSANPDLTHLVRRIFLILVIIASAITLLEILQIPLTAFAFISGAIAIGVGFGAQNIINNFISGWILMWERPIRIGDFLELGDTRGRVEEINTRSTLIRRVDGVHLLIPNSQLLENTVVNWTLVDNLARTQVSVRVAYGSPVKKVKGFLQSVCEQHPDILQDPAPLVLFSDFADSNLLFDCVFWINTAGERDLRVVRSDLRFRIAEVFLENGIDFAYPQRDIHLDSRTPVEVRIVEVPPQGLNEAG